MLFESSKELTMNRSIRNLCILGSCLLALLVFVAGSATAQTFRGIILGTVTDSSGGTVPGATVTIKNVDTGLTRTLTTSDDGSYSAPELPIGNYSVTVEKQGFKTGLITGIKVEVSTERRADVTLQTGELSQKVEVLGEELPMVETTSNNMGGIVEANTVENLPVNGRDYQKLILLVPGASSDSNGITDSPGSFGTVSVNGARGRSNNYLLDGTDMNDGYRNDPAINEGGVFGTPATILPIEAIAEVHVASNFEAEYGRSAGAAINIVTKSGTNDWHGSAFDYLRNTALNARNFFDLASAGPQQPFHLNQFGGSFGGPIKHDKTFFFVDYEGVRETGAESSPGCVPIAADISEYAPTPGDLTSINPVIQNLLKLNPWPAATNPNVDCYANGGGTNITISTPFSNRVDNAIVKIDHEFNKNNMLTGRYYIGDSTQLFPLALTGGGDLPNYSTRVPTRVQLISLSYVSVLSPSMVNETRLGWNRFAEGFFAQDSTFNPYSIGLDVTGLGTPNNGNSYNFGLPVINVAGLPQLGSDKADPRQRVDTNWHFMDNISWKSGKHDIKFGYEFRRTSISQIFNRVFRGRLGFDSLSTFLQGVPLTSPFHSLQVTGDTNRNTFENSHAFYLQDSYRLSRRLTLNLGLRYDYFGIIQEKHDMFANVDPTTGDVFRVGQGRLYQPDYKNWAPRVSVAWDVTGKGKTVVRAGFGIFYDSYSQDMFMGHLPFSSLFDPGPAYSGLPGVGQISLATPATDGEGNALPLALNQPVFANFAPMADAFGVNPHIRTPYMENFNLNLQQQLTRKVVLQVGYVGSQGHKLLNFTDINQPSAAQIWAADCAGVAGVTYGQPCPSGTINDFSVPRRLTGNNITYIYWEGSGASSNYNSFQTTLRIDNWHGLTTGLSYTWSHSIDTASDGEDYVPNAAQPTDSTNPSSNRGNSNFDVRNRLSWNFNYEFPNRKGSLEKLTNGWGVDSIVTVQSGAPFSMILEYDDYDGAGTDFPKPDVVGPIKYNYSDPTHFLDLSSFAAPCTPLPAGFDGTAATCTPGTRHFGNEGRNSLIGPAFREVDFSIFKKTSLTERVKMELRFEAYNLFNHPNFASPLWPNFLSDPTNTNSFGSNGRLQGYLPINVTADVGAGYPVIGGGGPRSMQVAAKFTF
jgi:outer membrane receptor protein involved in Fe transport